MSRYFNLPACDTPSADGASYVDILQINVPPLTQDLDLVTLNAHQAGRFESLVKQYCGSSEMDWVVLWNNKFACNFDLQEGTTLMIGRQ